MTKFVIIGGGIGGILAAYLCASRVPSSEVTIIEKAPRLGGLLAGTHYAQNSLYFDIGTHIPRETGDADVDDFFLSSIDSSNLIRFERGKGDLAGSFFNGHLQSYSHFPDIRYLPHFDTLRSSLEQAAYQPSAGLERQTDIKSQALSKFGSEYSETVLFPILNHLYQRDVNSLAGFSLELPGLTRVIAHQLADWQELVGPHQNLRSLFAIPEQTALPKEYTSPYHSFYTRNGGTGAMVESWHKKLLGFGIQIHTDTTIENIDQENYTIRAKDKNGQNIIYSADHIIITTGVMGAARLLGHPVDFKEFDKPMPHRIVNLVTDFKHNSDLYYFYGLDQKADYYRVTNYAAITGNDDDRRLSIEVLGDRADNDQTLVHNLLHQLHAANFIDQMNYSFSDVITIPTGFPVPTVKNLAAMKSVRDSLNNRRSDHIMITGIGCSEGLFFQSEIMDHIITTVTAVS